VPPIVDGTRERGVEAVVGELVELGPRFPGFADVATLGNELVEQPLAHGLAVARPLSRASGGLDAPRSRRRFGSTARSDRAEQYNDACRARHLPAPTMRR